MKLRKYIYLSLLGLSMASCSDFLVENPQTEVSSEGVYSNLSSAKAALSGVYAQLTGYNYFGFNYFHVVNTSSGRGVSLKANDVNLTTMNALASDRNITKMYNGHYDVIKSANDIIQGMQKTSIQSEAEVNRIEGEARLVRGMTYFNLVRLFGKVPMVLKPVESYDEAQAPRAEVAKVYESIVSDLEQAYNLLPEPANKVAGHPHKYAAQALLAKVYLTLAGNEEGSEYWQKAYDAAKDVYDNGQYQLVRPYENLFGSMNNNNEESIIEVQFSSAVNSGRLTETTFPIGCSLMYNIVSQGKSWGKTRPTQKAFAQFDEADPRRDASFVYGQYTNIFEPKPFKKNVMLFPTKKADAKSLKLFYKRGDSEYPAWKKYVDPTMTASSTNCNFVYYRYADLLLVLAEAANEIGSADAADYLNMVLDRARDANGNGAIDEGEVYPLALTPEEASNKEAFRSRVMLERLKELTGECDEWYTVRRRGEQYLKEVMVSHNDFVNEWYGEQKIDPKKVKFVYTYDVTDDNVRKNMLLPFPSDEIATNEKISQDDQNYGY